jgi:hypothetical protein
MRTPATTQRRAEARSQMIRLLAERLVRQALSEQQRPAKASQREPKQ